MYKNFASQPPAYLYGGSLTADDLKSNVSSDGDFFNKPSHFVECTDCGQQPKKLNAGGNWGGYIDKAFGVISNYQQGQNIDSATQLQEQQNREQALILQQQEIDLQKEQEKSSIIKSYGIPIAIGGGIIIVGIATYFIFKKKAS
jgi:hypothetical protein